jgi:hypothetical protein
MSPATAAYTSSDRSRLIFGGYNGMYSTRAAKAGFADKALILSRPSTVTLNATRVVYVMSDCKAEDMKSVYVSHAFLIGKTYLLSHVIDADVVSDQAHASYSKCHHKVV